VPAKVNHSRLMEAYSQTLCTLLWAVKQVNEMVVDNTTRMNVRWKTGSEVKRAREKTSVCETDYKEEMICGIDEF